MRAYAHAHKTAAANTMSSALALPCMSQSELSNLSALELAEYLQEFGVSIEAREQLVDNNVSGRALLLIDDNEIKELLSTIGDRAIVRDLVRGINKVGPFIYIAKF